MPLPAARPQSGSGERVRNKVEESEVGTAGSLLADPQPLDHALVARVFPTLEVIEQAPSLPDELQQSATRMVILRVQLEVPREVRDPLRQERDLYLGGSRVAGRTLVRLQDRLLALLDD